MILFAIITAYNLVASQTSDHPCQGSYGDDLCFYEQVGIQTCASNDLPPGSVIEIPEVGKCYVMDRLNSRYDGTGRIDVVMKTKEAAIAFGKRKEEIEVLTKKLL